jgi:hypothetical protein
MKGLKVLSLGCTYRVPGRAFAGKRHVWHCTVSESDTRVSVRASLAQVVNYLHT